MHNKNDSHLKQKQNTYIQRFSAVSTLTLDQLPFGQPAVITHLLPESLPFRRRLLAMGITPGSHVTVIRTAPMGDPLEIKTRGFYLCLRRSEAKAISVAEVKK